MNILVTGSNGLLGQAVSKMFIRETDHDIMLTSAEDGSYVKDIHEYHTLDITRKDDVKKIASEFIPDVIVNCAAFTNVDLCETERELSWKINVDGVKNLIIAARINNARVIHFSTDYVFDGKNGPYSEEDVPNPISFYGREKLASENALKTSDVNHTIIRTLVLYGTGEKVKSNFVLWMIDKLKNNEPVNIVTDQISNVTMIEDLALGTMRIVDRGCSGIYNIAGNDILSRYDFAMKVCEVFGYDKGLVRPITSELLNQPAPRPMKSGLTTFKAEAELGFRTMDSLEGLQLLKYQLGS
ncbi:MAG: dTDP-4-dehydrorhamnose reductase [Ignavibacteria bacterium]|jgi:dTDP-4-dehydrorhamnose reductase|nr:dTDP-4-dehydrorhamnose reductase [Ignavibacteria bacterium]MBK9227056.1 dTDP-4-dehydrorhamnose reductase [Ignavibacteria bacterium]